MARAQGLGPEVIPAEMVTGGAEWSFGVINGRDFGPAVMIALGGVMVERLPERAVLMAPFTVEAAAQLSQLAHVGRRRIEEMDVNPVIVKPDRAVAVDVLIAPRETASGRLGG